MNTDRVEALCKTNNEKYPDSSHAILRKKDTLRNFGFYLPLIYSSFTFNLNTGESLHFLLLLVVPNESRRLMHLLWNRAQYEGYPNENGIS